MCPAAVQICPRAPTAVLLTKAGSNIPNLYPVLGKLDNEVCPSPGGQPKMAFRRSFHKLTGRLARQARCFSAVTRVADARHLAGITGQSSARLLAKDSALPSAWRSFAAAAEPAPVEGLNKGRITQVTCRCTNDPPGQHIRALRWLLEMYSACQLSFARCSDIGLETED